MLVVRLPYDLHHRAKLEAYTHGMTLQEWMIKLLEKEFNGKYIKTGRYSKLDRSES